MRKLKRLGMDKKGLKSFYIAKIRSLLTTNCVAWITFLSEKCRKSLEAIQRSATRVILPDLDYESRYQCLDLPTLAEYMDTQVKKHFTKIMQKPEHPVCKKLQSYQNNCRKTRHSTTFKMPKCRTKKRQNSFFVHCIKYKQ